MTFDLAAALSRGETFEQEFKRGSINDRELTEAVVCLANGSGGVLLVGVEDNATVTGARPRHGTVTDPHRLAAMIQNLTEPAHPVEVSLVDHDGPQVIVVSVPAADPGPIATKGGLYVKRALGSDGRPQCVPMTPHEIVSMGCPLGASTTPPHGPLGPPLTTSTRPSSTGSASCARAPPARKDSRACPTGTSSERLAWHPATGM